jgi:ribonuclease G
VREIMTRPCPVCGGDGVVLSEETIAIEFERRMRELASRAPRKVEAFLLRMHPHVTSQFTGNQARVLHALEAETGKRFHFTGSEGLPHDYFDVVLEGTEEEVREKAIPFRAGDEVLVTIVEPHMYAVDDAVAKVDGYIISVAGGGSHVGEKRLVRIEEAGRSSATAVLVDDGRGSANGAPSGESKPPARKRARPQAKPAARAAAGAEPAGRRAAGRSDDGEPAASRAAGRSDDGEPASADSGARSSDEPAGADSGARSSDEPAGADSGARSSDDAEPAAKPARKRTRSRAKPVAKTEESDEGADGAAPEAETEGSGDDAVESTPRRRGRRGGRRRSAAKAQATSSD